MKGATHVLDARLTGCKREMPYVPRALDRVEPNATPQYVPQQTEQGFGKCYNMWYIGARRGKNPKPTNRPDGLSLRP